MSLNKVSVIFIILFSPLIFAQTLNISKQFADCGVKGSTTIYDYKNNQWYYSDKSDAQVPTLPASTFKIINSLIALETKAVQDEKKIIAWDGEDKKFFGASMKEWNKDTNLAEAYKNSTVWFYVEMAKRIGSKKYKEFLTKANYGNGALKFNQNGDFWNYGGFAVSPVEQINFLVRLYNNELPFSKRNMESVKQIMRSRDDNNGILRGKTGWTRKDGKILDGM